MNDKKTTTEASPLPRIIISIHTTEAAGQFHNKAASAFVVSFAYVDYLYLYL